MRNQSYRTTILLGNTVTFKRYVKRRGANLRILTFYNEMDIFGNLGGSCGGDIYRFYGSKTRVVLTGYSPCKPYFFVFGEKPIISLPGGTRRPTKPNQRIGVPTKKLRMEVNAVYFWELRAYSLPRSRFRIMELKSLVWGYRQCRIWRRRLLWICVYGCLLLRLSIAPSANLAIFFGRNPTSSSCNGDGKGEVEEIKGA